MLTLKTTAQFRKDYKLAKKRGHALSGDYTGFRECHIQPNWLLIYLISRDVLVLTAARTGTHADLFGR